MNSHNIVLSGSGLWTPDNIITNEELVTAYNSWATKFNEENTQAIAAGHCEEVPLSSVEFIEKASGIKQRFAYVKEGILDVNRMRPKIPLRGNDQISDQAEIAIKAARQA